MSIVRARQLVELRRFKEALTSLDGLGDDGRTPTALCLRAQAHLGLGELKDAERAAAAAREGDPHDEWGFRLGAIAARRQRRPRAAYQLAQQAVSLAPWEPYTHQVATLAALDLGRTAEALDHAHEMCSLDPQSALSHYTLGLSQRAAGSPADAEYSLRRALELDPQHPEAMSALADIVERSDASQARDLRLEAVRSNPQSDTHRRNLLRRGGAVGGFLALSKVGFFGKLIGFNVLRDILSNTGSPLLAWSIVGGLYLGAFGISRILRWRHGRSLPPLVWKGLVAERRNADLLWIAWPAAFIFVGLLLASVLALGHDGPSLGELSGLSTSALALTTCWALRRGAARDKNLRQATRDFAAGVRFVVQRAVSRPRGRGPHVPKRLIG